MSFEDAWQAAPRLRDAFRMSMEDEAYGALFWLNATTGICAGLEDCMALVAARSRSKPLSPSSDSSLNSFLTKERWSV